MTWDVVVPIEGSSAGPVEPSNSTSGNLSQPHNQRCADIYVQGYMIQNMINVEMFRCSYV